MQIHSDRVTLTSQGGRTREAAQFRLTIGYDQMARMTEAEILDRAREMLTFHVHGAKLEADRRVGVQSSTAVDRVRAYLVAAVDLLGQDYLDGIGGGDLLASDLQEVLDLAQARQDLRES